MLFMRQQQIIQLLTMSLLLLGTPALAQYPGQFQNQQGQSPQQGTPYNQGAPPNQPQGQLPAGSFNNQSMMPPNGRQPQAPSGMTIGQWFGSYDQIRRAAQMNPAERQQADGLMSRGIGILVPGEEKAATKQILGMMIGRYQRACMQLKQLPQIPPTQKLQIAYFNYFNTAAGLFYDYVRVQDNILLQDATTGTPVVAGLLQRKQMLTMLEGECKQIDAATRAQFGVPTYQF